MRAGVFICYVYTTISTTPQPVSSMWEELVRHLLNEYHHQELEEAMFPENLFHSVPIIK